MNEAMTSTISNDEFRHERLKLPGGFMRLLQIQGGANTKTQKDTTISLRITQYAIHRLPPYVAISYTWGSALTTRPIRVNGRPFHVRLNLWNLLWHLRQRGEARFLWIDALCIDQRNLVERNFHVQLMGNIYDKAVTAIVWLGLPSDDRRQARVLEFIGEMAAAAKKYPAEVAKFRDKYLTDSCANRWGNVLELCRGAYWTRTWIIQEFVQASRIEVLCGTASLEWVHFEDVVRMLRSISTPSISQQQPAVKLPPFVAQFMQTLPVRLTTRRIFHTSSTLEELISEFYDSKCAERRDKIYGMLGIAGDCNSSDDKTDAEVGLGVVRGPKPDYSKHILEVYFEVFEYLLSSTQGRKSPLLAIYLTQKSLGLSENDLDSYITYLGQQDRSSDTPLTLETRLLQLNIPLRPDYINVISETLPGWTSMRDLRQRLDQVDWSRYVGHEIKRKSLSARLSSSGSGTGLMMPVVTSRRKSSFNSSVLETGSNVSGTSTPTGRPIRAPLPNDMIDNALYVAEHATDALQGLHNYPMRAINNESQAISISHIHLTQYDKHVYLNGSFAKPTIIIESSRTKGVDPVRIGFACTEARAGDLICQFSGLEQTIVVRRGDGGLRLVGLARMVTHEGLTERAVHPGVKKSGQGHEKWSSCVATAAEKGERAGEKDGDNNDASDLDDEIFNHTLDLDPISWWELLRGG